MNRISDFGLRVVRQTSKYATCHCPLHDDKHASALVYLDNMWFVCFVCNISKPLEKVLQDAGMEWRGVERSIDIDDIDLMSEVYKVQPLTAQAIDYLFSRGIDSYLLPDYIASPVHNKGISFCFKKNNGQLIGSQVRLFPENVAGKSWRYIFEGQRLPYMGNIASYYVNGYKLFVFEKAFATLKAQIATNHFDLPVAPISSVGAHFQRSLLDITNVNTTFFFDNDIAGMNSARQVKKLTGARVIVSGQPLDELSIDDMRGYLQKYL